MLSVTVMARSSYSTPGEYEMTLTPNLLYLATNIKHITLFPDYKKEFYREKAASHSYRN